MRQADVLVVGGGAAGLMAALAARGALGRDGAPCPPPEGAPSVALLNATERLGLKILASGGGRCNVTNEEVGVEDFETDSPPLLRAVLKGFPPRSVRAWFAAQGVELYAEPQGKLFPVSDRARDVLAALERGARQAGVELVAPARVVDLVPEAEGGWRAELAEGGPWRARRVILATGGKSLPKTGSTGFGLELLARLGHTVAPPRPALTPLLLDPEGPFAGQAGVTHPTVLTLVPRGTPPEQVSGARFRPLARAGGSLLVTHRGATGPAALDVSGACTRALEAGAPVSLLADVWSLTDPTGPWGSWLELPKAPGACLRAEALPRPPTREAFLAALSGVDRERSLGTALAGRVPRGLLAALLARVELDPTTLWKRLDPRALARLHLALTQADLGLRGSEGFAKAEVTAGGVLLGELSRGALASRLLPGLFCCGEVVNVTGRLGGFNFQWAWASGVGAGEGARASLS